MNTIINKVKGRIKTFSKHVKKVAVTAMAVVGCATAAVPVFAQATANSALTEAATATANQISADINAVIPIALGLMGLVLGITIGIRIFRSLAKAGTRG